jgi:transcriptional regulator with XRE-family HTH domain
LADSLRDPRYRAVIERLIEIRKAAKVNQRDFAERMGQLHSFVGKVELFERRLDFVQLIDWLRALGVDEREFCSDVLAKIPKSRRRRS